METVRVDQTQITGCGGCLLLMALVAVAAVAAWFYL